MDAQLQIRQNAQEVQDYMRDLFAWEKAVKEKKGAKSGTSSRKSAAAAPAAAADDGSAASAPRGRARGLSGGSTAGGGASGSSAMAAGAGPSSAQQQQQQQQQQGMGEAQPGSAAAHTYKNYDRWNQFDVDAALKDASDDEGGLDSSGRGGGGSSSSRSQAQLPRSAIPSAPGMAPIRGTRTTSSAAGAAKPAAAPAQQHRAAVELVQPQTQQQQQAASAEPSTAEGWKDRGNKWLQAGHLAEAIACYDRSIAVRPTCLAHANRALAHLKLKMHAAAEEDATAALALDPLYAKAWQRRAAARKEAQKWLEAAEDYEEALRLEPGNKSVRGERDACLEEHTRAAGVRQVGQRRALKVEGVVPEPMEVDGAPQQPQPQQQQQQHAAAVPSSARAAQGQLAAAQQQQQPPKAAVAPSVRAAGQQQQGAATASVATPPDAVFTASSGADTTQTSKGVAAPAGTVAAPAAAAAAAAAPRTPSPIAAAAAAMAPRGVSPDEGQIMSDLSGDLAAAGSGAPLAAKAAQRGGAASSGSASAAGATSTSHPPSAQPSPRERQQQRVAAAAAAAAEQLAARMAGDLRVPKNSIEFESTWRALKGDATLQSRYLALLDPKQLPIIFKYSMTPQVLVAITRVALAAAAGGGAAAAGAVEGGSSGGQGGSAGVWTGAGLSQAAAVALLAGLTKVPRFPMMAMCIGAKEKGELRGLWDEAAAAGQLGLGLAGQLQSLRRSYRV